MVTDRFTIRTVVVGLVVAVIGGVAAMAYLAFTQTPVPDPFDRLVTFLAGALTSVLVTTSSHGDEAQPVQIVNEPEDAVPTEDVKK